MEATLIAREVCRDPLLEELITKDVILLAIGSTTFQNLEFKLRSQVVPKIQIFLPPEEMPLLYLSENRTQSIEDCIHFFPSLFKLTKSIVVAEPLSTTGIPGLQDTSFADLSVDLNDSKGPT